MCQEKELLIYDEEGILITHIMVKNYLKVRMHQQEITIKTNDGTKIRADAIAKDKNGNIEYKNIKVLKLHHIQKIKRRDFWNCIKMVER
ncbi:hypothetical protein [Clostridium sp. VAP51]|uniref:hypothetical protein n=1 Tax=Clostridium sp. VAP51 TaxID=2949978 RepID=UPI00207AA24B|nr:hypothetical protein [Clostridium sp. VAP51]